MAAVLPGRAVSTQSLPTRTPKKVPVVSGALSERGNNDGTGPFTNPQSALKTALKTITSDDWQQKVDAMNDIERLAAHHPQDLQMELHSVVLALLPEVRNLRSSVSRMAINTLGELFQTFKRHMETDLDLITKTLLHKSGENIGFIREDIDNTMRHLVEGVSSQKAALAIVAGGASHRNPAVRKTAAQLLSVTVEKLGSARCLTGCKDVAEKVLPATASFVMDCSPLARYYGRKIFFILMEHPDFESSLQKSVSASTIRNISSILDSIRRKGIGEMPKEGFSANSSKTNLSRSRLLRSKN
ncbi:TOG array regulator of axonemal microtubules protein 1-like [Limulus polyphemus]|uniref:TOG array regulator of axonemal microtubules protein 1-like n=1 Tax=Limulus polyphemus TaxID=6850 RepID=A0ABM1SPC7_LIMPO|nr:TOG array regulator of axonemal microtubules protein 1-like [Limulus polyphemus]